LASSGLLVLSGTLLLKQACLGDGVSFDVGTSEQDRLAYMEVNQLVSAFEALMAAPLAVVVHERCDLRFQITG